MIVEVIFYERIGPHKPGDVVELIDGPFVGAVVRGGKGDVVNPPDWSLDGSHLLPKEPKVNGESDRKPEPVAEVTERQSGSAKGSAKKSTERASEDATVSSKGYRNV